MIGLLLQCAAWIQPGRSLPASGRSDPNRFGRVSNPPLHHDYLDITLSPDLAPLPLFRRQGDGGFISPGLGFGGDADPLDVIAQVQVVVVANQPPARAAAMVV